MAQEFTYTKLEKLNEEQTKAILQNSFPNEFRTFNLDNVGDVNGDLLLLLTEKELEDEFEIKTQETRINFLKQIERYKRNGVPIMGNMVVREDEVTQSSLHRYHQDRIIELVLTDRNRKANTLSTKLLHWPVIESTNASPGEDTVKQILFLGETGSGKSTLINSIVNALIKLEQSDQFRFKLIDNEQQTGSSSTNAIRGYTWESEHSSYSYVFWDTPGFFNTEGFECDTKTTKDIEQFMDKVQELDAIVIVEKFSNLLGPKSSNKAKLLNGYLYHKMLSYFGEGVIPFVHLFLTFPTHYEEVTPNLSHCAFPFLPDQVYTINNTVMYESEPANTDISKLLWERNFKIIERFFDKMHARGPVNLTSVARHILEHRHQLELSSKEFIARLEKIKKNTREYTEYGNSKKIAEKEMNENKDYYVNEKQIVRESIPTRRKTTYCTECVFTCHADCLRNSQEKKTCEAFNTKGQCQVCPKKCPVKSHRDHPYIIEDKEVTKRVEDKIKKQIFDDAVAKLKVIEGEIETCDNEYNLLENDAVTLMKKIETTLGELNTSAPYFQVNSTYNYLSLIKQQTKCTQFEIEALLTQYVNVWISKNMSKPAEPKERNPKNDLRDLNSGVEALEKELLTTKF